MKIYARKQKHSYIIEIEVEFTEESFEIAATTYVEQKDSIPKKFRYTEAQLLAYNKFISDVLNILKSYKFDIKDNHQSSASYAYYIEFLPKDKYGKELEHSVSIQFRIADHKRNDKRKESVIHRSAQIIRDFRLGSRKYPTQVYVCKAISIICEELKQGNYDILEEVDELI